MAKDTNYRVNHLLNFRGRLHEIKRPMVMGILNLTPDSFYDGGKYQDENAAVSQCRKMLNEGADIIDIGAASTRPGASLVKAADELKRLQGFKTLRKEFPEAVFSIDTYNSETARSMADEGADIINDISGGTIDPQMPKTMAELKLPYILMHIKGTPANMQQDPQYENVYKEVAYFFSLQLRKFLEAGVNDLILDPGFGFAKNLDHNYELLNKLPQLKSFGFPILAGFSRKSMVNKVLGTKAAEALNGTTVLNTIALQNGADILRVHDVKEAREVVKIVTFTQNLA